MDDIENTRLSQGQSLSPFQLKLLKVYRWVVWEISEYEFHCDGEMNSTVQWVKLILYEIEWESAEVSRTEVKRSGCVSEKKPIIRWENATAGLCDHMCVRRVSQSQCQGLRWVVFVRYNSVYTSTTPEYFPVYNNDSVSWHFKFFPLTFFSHSLMR